MNAEGEKKNVGANEVLPETAKTLIEWTQQELPRFPEGRISCYGSLLKAVQELRPLVDTVIRSRNPSQADRIDKDFDYLYEKARQVDRTRSGECDGGTAFSVPEIQAKKAARRLADELEIIAAKQGGALGDAKLPVLAGLAESAEDDGVPELSEEDEWITCSEAAKIAGVNKGTISKWANSGQIETNGKTGPERRISKSSLHQKIGARKAESRRKCLEKDVEDLDRDAKNVPQKH